MLDRQAPAQGQVVVEMLHDRAAIGALAPAWERLRAEMAAQGRARGPFLSPAWFAVYAASLATGPEALVLLVAHRAGEVVGILPLLRERRRLSGVPARVLRSLSDDHSQRFDLIAADDEAARAMFRHLARNPDWDVLELRELPASGPCAALALVDAARHAGLPTAAWPAMRSPRLPLPASAEALERSFSPKFRANLKRRRKKLEAEVGAVALERVPNDAPRVVIERALDDGFRLEAAGYKGALGTAIACVPALRRRYTALALAFARRDALALYFLTVGGARKAFHFAIVEDGVYYLFKPGYDPALASYGLGHLLVAEVARDLIGRGVRELDFLGDEMPWKREWTEAVRPHVWRYVFRGPWGRALFAWKFRLVPRLKKLRDRYRR